jgi:hypothetical protein
MKSPYESPQQEVRIAKENDKKPQWPIHTILSITAASVLYRLIVLNGKEQSAILFIGIPVILAILLYQSPNAKSPMGKIMKGITLFLLIFGILFIEGLICILLAAPLFYFVGFLVGLILNLANRSPNNGGKIKCVALGALLLTSIEGSHQLVSFERTETIELSQQLSISAADAKMTLAAGPSIDLASLPLFLKLGFPQPQSIQGSSLEVGSIWRVHFAGGEGEPGDLVVRVQESTATRVRFVVDSDSSHIAHWLDWKDVIWTFTDTPNGCLVALTVNYDRQLDPGWYFAPAERFGVRQASQFFLDECFKTDANRQLD